MLEFKCDSDDQNIKKICSLYWEQSDGKFVYTVERLSSICGMRPGKLLSTVKSNSYTYQKSSKCSSCSEAERFYTRSDYLHRKNALNYTCQKCTMEKNKLEAEQRRKEYEKMEKKLREKLKDICESAKAYNNDISEFEPRHAILLYAFIYGISSENLDYLNTYDDSCIEIYPNGDGDSELIESLRENNLIVFDPDRHSELWIRDGNIQYDPSTAHWKLTNEKYSVENFMLKLFTRISGSDFINDYRKDIAILAEEVAIKECLAYMKIMLEQRNLSFSPGKKTLLLFEQLIQKYSVAEIFNFIWRGAKSVSDYYMTGQVYRNQAGKAIIGTIKRIVAKVEEEGKWVKPFDRKSTVSQCLVSEVIYNRILRSSDYGFKVPIGEIFSFREKV